MNAPLNLNQVGYINPGLVTIEDCRQDSYGNDVPIYRSSKFGLELGSMEIARNKIGAYMMERARLDGVTNYSADQCRQDAEDFAGSLLTQILSPAENVKRGEGKQYMFVRSRGEELIPSRQTVDIGANAAQYEVREPTAQAMWLNLADLSTAQNADTVGDVMTYKPEWYGLAYQVTVPETWSQKFTRRNIQSERSDAAMLGLDDFQESVSSWGDSTKGITGAFTMGNAAIVLGGPAFSSGTPGAADMVLQIGSIEGMYMRANGEMPPSGVVMPRSDMIALKNTYFTNTGITAWSNAIQNYPWLANAKVSDRMQLANAAGTGPRWALFGRDPMKMHIEHTDSMVFGPFTKDLTTYFYIIRRHGGLIAKVPEMMFYVDFTV